MSSDLTAPSAILPESNEGPCLSPASFWTADHIVDSAWLEHGPFAFWLIDAIRPRRFVELGSHNGFSYFCVCQAVRTLNLGTTCFAIDSWEGDEHAGFYGEDVFASVAAVQERHYSNFSTLMRSYFSDALPYFADGSIDLLHIDGRHGYEDVAEDFGTWRRKLSPRGVVIFHDTNVRERNFGVWRLWAELREQFPSFEFVHGHGLGVLALGPEIPDGLKPLVFASAAERVAIESRYARLGRAFFMQREADRAKTDLGYLRQSVRDFERTTGEQRAQIATLDESLAASRQEQETRLHAAEMAAREAAAAAAAQAAAEAESAAAEAAAALAASQAAAAAAEAEAAQAQAALALAEGEAAAAQAKQAVAETKAAQALAAQALAASRAAAAEAQAQAAQMEAEAIAAAAQAAQAEAETVAAAAQAAHVKAAAVAEAIADHAISLRGELRVAGQTIGQLNAQIHNQPQPLPQPDLLAERDRLRQELDSIYNSTFWRRTDPWRRQLARHPRLRRVLLGGAKLFWWSVTLRLRQRLRTRKAARQAIALLNAPRDDTAPLNDKARLTAIARDDLAHFLASGERINLAAPDAPEISILLILWNQAHLTLRCLRAIAAATGPSREVILLDNGSTDETGDLLERLDGARIIRSPDNLGFLRGCNRAASEARGRTILLLNNDAFLRPDALHAALSSLDSAPDIGAVGARIIVPSGRLQEAGSIVWADGSCLGYLRDEAPDAFPAMFRRDVDYCSGAFLLIRRDLWQGLGGFDEAFAPAYYEETDFCMRVQQSGFRVIYDPAVVIDHFEFGSEAAGGDSTSAMRRNQALFRERHAATLRRKHLAPGVEAILPARSAAARPRPHLLVIDNEVPLGAAGAGYPRARELLAAAVRAGWAVTLFPLHMVSVDWAAAWREIPREVEIVTGHGGTAEGFRAFLRQRRGFYDTVMISRPENMTLVRGYLAVEPDLLGGARLVYDSEALAATRAIAQARFDGRPLPEVEAEAMITEELALARHADSIVCVNAAEARQFARHGVPVHVLAHTIPCRTGTPGWDERGGLLFIGRLMERDAPNWIGLAWFIQKVWPHIRRSLPQTTLSVVGRLHPEHGALEAPGVLLLGPLDDLGPAYDAARVFIAPVHFAAGVPLKVIEAAAAGVPVVGTSLMAEQLLWQPQHEIETADDAVSFARACLALHEDAALWQAQRDAAQARAAADYGAAQFDATVGEILRGLPSGPPADAAG